VERVRCLAGGLVHNLRRRTFPAPLSAQRRGIEQPGSSPVTSRSLCLDLGQGFLFTGVRGRVILRSTHPGSRIERLLRAPGSPSEGLPTERQGPHVVVADRYAARRIVTALQNSPPGPSAFLCDPQRKGGAHVHKKQAIRYPAVLQVASFWRTAMLQPPETTPVFPEPPHYGQHKHV